VVAAGGWDEESKRLNEYDLMLRMLAAGGKVAFDGEPGAEHRLVNPESVYHRDLPETWREQGLFQGRAVDALSRRGELTEERRLAAARRGLLIARRLWPVHRGYSREVERVAAAIAPEIRTEAPRRWPLYGRIYRRLGFGAAQRYDSVAKLFRR
jgi:hypothetical protein